MKIYKGKFHCEEDGDFEWSTGELEPGERAFYRIKDVQKHCLSHYVDPVSKVCHATVYCPVCFHKFHVMDPA